MGDLSDQDSREGAPLREWLRVTLPAQFKPCVPLGAGLGLRQGEIFAFSLDNVDRDAMVYHCTRQMVPVDGVRKFKLPQGHKTRELPLGDGVLEDLDAYAELYPPVSWSTAPETSIPGYTRQAFNNVIWRPTFKKAGLSYEDHNDGMHAMRHLFASLMLERGVTIKELAAFLGHASEGFTLKTYVHLMPTSYHRARLAVNDIFKPRRTARGAEETA